MYRDCWEALHNYFLPSAKLSGKHREGAEYRRQHDAPQTPCERLLKSRGLSAKAKKELRERYANYNPFALGRERESRLRAIFCRPCTPVALRAPCVPGRQKLSRKENNPRCHDL